MQHLPAATTPFPCQTCATWVWSDRHVRPLPSNRPVTELALRHRQSLPHPPGALLAESVSRPSPTMCPASRSINPALSGRHPVPAAAALRVCAAARPIPPAAIHRTCLMTAIWQHLHHPSTWVISSNKILLISTIHFGCDARGFVLEVVNLTAMGVAGTCLVRQRFLMRLPTRYKCVIC